MHNFSDSMTHWDRLNRYVYKDGKYKDQARKIICDSLGFEPPIFISMIAELTFRQNLRKIDLGLISKDVLEQQIEIQTELIEKTFIPKYAPDLVELVKSHKKN
ncbi:MAG: hypothetical protein AAFX55_18505 [Bacteroidota bacterium]